MRPSFPRVGTSVLCALALWIAFGARPLRAADFPPVTSEERQLTAVDWQPGASAVMLSNEGVLRLWGAAGTQKSSILTVRARVKVLTEAGIEEVGKLEIHHSRFWRLKKFQGRTVLPDGRELPLSEDAIFRRQSSRSWKQYVTSAAFPGVEVGAILDYRYEIAFDSHYHLEPWVFQTNIPALRSQITVYVPRVVEVETWQSDPMGLGLRSEVRRDTGDAIVRAWVERAPALLNEPYSFPANDLAAKFMMVPIQRKITQISNVWRPELASWRVACNQVRSGHYDYAKRNSGSAKREARQLVSALDKKAKRQRAEAIYRFVRDEIETLPGGGAVLSYHQSLARVMNDRTGDHAEKGLLLATMLEAIKIDVDLVLAASRSEGRMNPQIPNPYWLDRLLVRAQIDGEEIFLDPCEHDLPFGVLDADFEGTQALLFSTRNPEILTLPVRSWKDNLKHAQLSFEIDEGGRLSGAGTLLLKGHFAVGRLNRPGGPVERWREWLSEHMNHYEISDVAVEKAENERQMEVRWSFLQLAGEVLGDEVSLTPSLPLGPAVQRFVLPSHKRRTPVMLPFGNQTVVEMNLTWPQGWDLDLLPKNVDLDNGAGAFGLQVHVDKANRTLRVSRRIEVHANQFMQPGDYTQLQKLWRQAATSDAQSLVLVRQ